MEAIITSASNPTVKQLRKLAASAKERKKTGMYIAEGAHLVQSFLTSGQIPASCVYAESALQNSEVIELDGLLDEASVRRIVVTDSLFESMASVHASVGILITFSLSPPAADAVETLRNNAVILEGVQDPGNLGTILRTAAAVGTKAIILSPDCTSPWSPRALRSGMGAQFSLSIYENMDLARIIQASAIPTLVTTLEPDSTSLYELDLRKPVAWIMGSEGQGASKALSALAAAKVFIPQASSSVESLNVAAAAAVCMYEQYRQGALSQLP